MIFHTHPAIKVLASPCLHSDALSDYTGLALPYAAHSADYLAEMAGRSCYWSYGKGRASAAYMENILSSGHGSTLEHANWTFGISGISRSLSHELVRHRHLSYSQLSQRYVTEEPEFVIPPAILDSGEPEGDFRLSCERAASDWRNLLKRLPDTKAGREAARGLLPNATATRMVVTGNARALRTVLALRGSEHADAEFRRLAVIWTALMKELAPLMFKDFSIVGGCVHSEYGHV